MTGKKLADHYRGIKAEVLGLYEAARAEVDERAKQHATLGMEGKGEVDAGVLVGKFAVDALAHYKEADRLRAITTDAPLSLAVANILLALCGVCMFAIGERAKAEGGFTAGRAKSERAQRDLNHAAELLLECLDRLEEVA